MTTTTTTSPVVETPAPVADDWSRYADPSAASHAIKADQSAKTYAQRGDDAQVRSAVATYREAREGATYKTLRESLALGSEGAVRNRIILGVMLAQVGDALTMPGAHIIRKASRVLAPNAATLAALLADAPTGAEFITYVEERKAEHKPAPRKPRPAVSPTEAEGTDTTTGTVHHAEAEDVRPATPVEVLAEATRLVTLAAHEGDATLTEAVRALTLAVVAYADAMPDANPYKDAAPARRSRKAAASA